MDARQLSDPAVEAHYAQAAAAHSDMLPMLRMVRRLCARPYAPHLQVSTSHDALCIRHGTGDVVVIAGILGGTAFDVTYTNALGKPEKHRCEGFEVERLVDSLVTRLPLSRDS